MHKTVLAALAGLALVPAAAWVRTDTPLLMQPESRIWVEGTSTTKSWRCKAPAVDADIMATSTEAPAAVLNGEKAVRSVTIRVASPKLDCGNGTMTSHALKAIKAGEHKSIVFTLTTYELAKAADGAKGTLRGTLALGGVTKPVSIVATARPAADGQMRVTGTHVLRMSDYGLTPPKLMLGAMKVGDDVTIGFDLLLKPAPLASPVP